MMLPRRVLSDGTSVPITDDKSPNLVGTPPPPVAPNAAPRRTQRAPKSCIECTRRKTKCDKKIPCNQCISRGEARRCTREIVVVKGSLRNVGSLSQRNDDPKLDYICRLEAENEYLSKKLLALSAERSSQASSVGPSSSDQSPSKQLPVSPEKQLDPSSYDDALNLLTRGLVNVLIDQGDDDSKDGQGDSSQQGPDLFSDQKYSRQPSLDLAFQAPELSYHQSNAIIRHNLENLRFIHMAVLSEQFYAEHENFWKRAVPKTLSLELDRGRKTYLWCALWYAMLSCGTYLSDETLAAEVGLPTEVMDQLPAYFAAASYECLHRGEFMRYPDILSVQTFCVLGLCFHGFLGVNFGDCLLNTIIQVCFSLNFDKLEQESLPENEDNTTDQEPVRFADRELSRRLWWTVVVIDWLQDTNRPSVISPSHYTTSMMGNYFDNELINGTMPIVMDRPRNVYTDSSYLLTMIESATIKRKYFSESYVMRRNVNIDNLLTALRKLQNLKNTLPEELSGRDTIKEMTTTMYFQRFLLSIQMRYDTLNVHRLLATVMPKAEWQAQYRPEAIKNAMEMLEIVLQSVPNFFKKNWVVSSHSLSAASFILLDILDCGFDDPERDKKIQRVQETLSFFHSLSSTHVICRRGLTVLYRLLYLVCSQPLQRVNGESALADAYEDLQKVFAQLKAAPRSVYHQPVSSQPLTSIAYPIDNIQAPTQEGFRQYQFVTEQFEAQMGESYQHHHPQEEQLQQLQQLQQQQQQQYPVRIKSELPYQQDAIPYPDPQQMQIPSGWASYAAEELKYLSGWNSQF